MYDLGSGFGYEWYSAPNVEKHGILLYKDGEVIGGCTTHKESGPAWDILQEDPLTLHPSIQTYDIDGKPQYHGWIQEGKWVSV